MDTRPLSYKPSAFYYRRIIRGARSRQEIEEVALGLVTEYERLREWVRDHGLVPPKWTVSPCELAEKRSGPRLVFPCESTAESSAKVD